jgi:hypothetical protein
MAVFAVLFRSHDERLDWAARFAALADATGPLAQLGDAWWSPGGLLSLALGHIAFSDTDTASSAELTRVLRLDKAWPVLLAPDRYVFEPTLFLYPCFYRVTTTLTKTTVSAGRCDAKALVAVPDSLNALPRASDPRVRALIGAAWDFVQMKKRQLTV